jgi:hypothetical protein
MAVTGLGNLEVAGEKTVAYRTNFLRLDRYIPLSRNQIPGAHTPLREVSMDYLIEARKFIQQARSAHNLEVIKTDLEMAEWFLSHAIVEREASGHDPRTPHADERPSGRKKT